MNRSIKHFGIPGMHWGVRKAQSTGGGFGPQKGKTVFRIGRKKGQSDAEFDKEYDAEMKQLHKEVTAERRAKAKKMLETTAKNREKTDALIKSSLAFRQAKWLDMKLGGNPDSSPAAVITRNLIGQMVVTGVTLALLNKYG